MKLRNAFWRWQYALAILLAMFCNTTGQSGGALCEAMHSSQRSKFPWAHKNLIGIARAPAVDELMTHSINYDVAKRLTKLHQKHSKKYSMRQKKETAEILSVLDASTGLDSIRNEMMDKNTKHGVIEFDFDKSLKQFMKSSVFLLHPLFHPLFYFFSSSIILLF